MLHVSSLFCKPNTGITVYCVEPSNCLGKLMVTTQLLLATGLSSPQLWISIMSSGSKWQGHAATSSTLTLSSSVFLGMTGDADSSGPALWPLTSLTTCGDILHVSLSTEHFPLRSVFAHCQTYFQWFLTGLMAVLPEFLNAYISFQSLSYSEPSVGLLLALYRQHQCISIGQGEPQFMVLSLAVFGCIDHSALGQQQVHIGARVLRTLIALH